MDDGWMVGWIDGWMGVGWMVGVEGIMGLLPLLAAKIKIPSTATSLLRHHCAPPCSPLVTQQGIARQAQRAWRPHLLFISLPSESPFTWLTLETVYKPSAVKPTG